MAIQLTEVEARVLGSLIEKSLTTPELYPLSLNGLVNACNQKTSRDPVMNLEESVVGQALFALIERGVAGRLHEPGARVAKFMHHADMLIPEADAKKIGILRVLLLRGPQTPGELKTRTDRLCEFVGAAEVESLLQELAAKPEPWVMKLPRQPGQKEVRYRHLFNDVVPVAAPSAAAAVPALPAAVGPDRVTLLEARVAALEAKIDELTKTAH